MALEHEAGFYLFRVISNCGFEFRVLRDKVQGLVPHGSSWLFSYTG